MHSATPADDWTQLSAHLSTAGKSVGLSPIDAELLARYIFIKFGREGHREGPSVLGFPNSHTICIEYKSNNRSVEHTFSLAILAQRFLNFERALPELTLIAVRGLPGTIKQSFAQEDFLQMLKARCLFWDALPLNADLRLVLAEMLEDYLQCISPATLTELFCKLGLTPQEASDNVTELPSQLHASVKSYRGLCNLKTWTQRIAKSLTAKEIDRQTQERARNQPLSRTEEDSTVEKDEFVDPHSANMADRACVYTCLLPCLRQMSSEEQILLLREWRGESLKEMCARLEGKSDAVTVAKYKMRALRAKQKLREQLPDCVCIKNFRS